MIKNYDFLIILDQNIKKIFCNVLNPEIHIQSFLVMVDPDIAGLNVKNLYFRIEDFKRKGIIPNQTVTLYFYNVQFDKDYQLRNMFQKSSEVTNLSFKECVWPNVKQEKINDIAKIITISFYNMGFNQELPNLVLDFLENCDYLEDFLICTYPFNKLICKCLTKKRT